jgi:UDP-glucose 4-epimerase
MKCFVTGAAGFIGSTLVDRLLARGDEVVGFDNFSTGLTEFLVEAQKHKKFTLHQGDLLDKEALSKAMRGCDLVVHFAANADVRFGIYHPHKDLEQNTIATFNVLEAMRTHQISKIVFSSTGSVYGEAKVFPTPEDAPFPVQTSFYGTSKIAGEGLISAYAEGFGFQAYIFRFVSILGERYTHGHVYDFYRQLLEHPEHLHILGNGQQKKSYLYVQDCVDAIFCALEHARERVNIFNLGTEEYCEVRDSAAWICESLQLQPQFSYEGGERGWIGDSPFIFLDTAKIRGLGWRPKLSIRQGVERTVAFLKNNPWVLKRS